ncbi:MAG: lipopolysaccharide transport system ATP-binding protein, partial [Kiritimatiellia bacterium]
MQPAISIRGVSKRYRLGMTFSRDTLRDQIASMFHRNGEKKSREDFWALSDVSFDVAQGDVVGIIGRNGAGKSTLLKVLSRITDPTGGEVHIRGRVASLLEVGTGFHPELSGRENIFMNGAILGMSKGEIRSKFDEIVAFAEVEKFIDTPVKRYSSGMYVRLAFSIAAHLEPEILLVDEVLAVGDAAFQRRCLGKMEEVAGSGRTILFVSHNMASIRDLCNSCVWLDQGRVRNVGETAQIIQEYLRESDQSGGKPICRFDADPAKLFQLLESQLLKPDGSLSTVFECDDTVRILCSCVSRQSVPGMFGYLSVNTLDGSVVLVSDSHDLLPNILDGLPQGNHSFAIDLPSRSLGPGDYYLYLNFASRTHDAHAGSVDTPGLIGRIRF